MRHGRLHGRLRGLNESISSFGWFSSNVERVKRKLAIDPSCPICGFHFEDLMHILRDCGATKNVWSQVITGNLSTRFFSLNLHDWIISNVQDMSRVIEGGTMWACLFGILIWRIWKNSNMFIFQGRSWSLSEIIQTSLCWANHCFSVSKADTRETFGHSLEIQSSRLDIIINTDGAVQLDSSHAAIGGVARDSNGE